MSADISIGQLNINIYHGLNSSWLYMNMRMDSFCITLTYYSQFWLLPSACLCCLMFTVSVNILLIKLHSFRYVLKTSWEKSLSLSFCYFLSMSLAHLFMCFNKRGPGRGHPPMWQFVTLCQPVECHWENITSANVALCDTAFEVKKKNLPLVNREHYHMAAWL